MAALSVALFMTACSSTQQAAPSAADAPAADAPTERPGNIFHTRGKPQAAPEAAPVQQEPSPAQQEPAPTEEQQKAAEELIREAATETPAPIPAPVEEAAPQPQSYNTTVPTGGLRMGSIIPQEDPASSSEAPPPGANSVELRGLRSPKLPSSLPMGIDGKLRSGH